VFGTRYGGAVNVFRDDGTELAAERVAELLERGEAQLVDVREAYEWDEGRIPGARHIELERLAARAGEIGRERPVVFQCRLGARSAMATAAFRASGWDAYNLTGGIQAWADAGLPMEPTDARVADH
jgi:rhodanese-related sulfurtransferase